MAFLRVLIGSALMIVAAAPTVAAQYTTCSDANPSDFADDTDALNNCLSNGGTIDLLPRGSGPGYIVGANPDGHGLVLSVSYTHLTNSHGGEAKILAADSLIAPLLRTSRADAYEIDNVVFDGNVYAHTRNPAPCYSPRTGGHNLELDGAGYVVHNIQTVGALCVTGLGVSGSNFNIYNVAVLLNGTAADERWNDSQEPWADGITVGACFNGWIHDNYFEDNTDIDLILGGGESCVVENNDIVHRHHHGFGGFMVAGLFANGRNGDHGGSMYRNNRVVSPTPNKLDYAAVIGSHTWDATTTIRNFSSIANTLAGAFVNLLVDGVADATVQGNIVYETQGDHGLTSCAISRDYTAAHASNSSLQGGFEPLYIHGGGVGDVCGYEDAHGAETYLYPEETWDSLSGNYHLHYQGDGNLVLYDAYWSPMWWTGTIGRAGSARMQRDGNFVVYDADGQPRWWSGTSRPGASLRVQDDGNLVIYDTDGRGIWSRR